MGEKQWLLLVKILSSSATQKEQEDFKEWLSASSENKNLFEDVKQYWDKSESIYREFKPDEMEAWLKVKANTISKAQQRKESKTRRLIGITSIAASILIIIGLSLQFNLIRIKPTFFLIETTSYVSYDSIEKIVLDDNSSVWLNSNSTLIVPENFNERSRKVELEGEAFFEVSHDPERAFFICTEGSFIKVLGTTFNVRAYPDETDIQVIVETGKVNLESKHWRKENKNLLPGEIGIYNKANRSVEKAWNKKVNYLTWKTGKFTFTNTLISEVCEDLGEYYRKTISIDETVNKEFTLNGSFDNTSLEDLLEIIEFTFDLNHTHQGEAIVLSSNINNI